MNISSHSSNPRIKIACHRCHTRYRVPSANRLTSGSRSTCSTCGARFAVVRPEAGNATGAMAIQSIPQAQDFGLNPSTSTAVASPETRCSFHGDGSTLFKIQVMNLCLSLATLGAYHFWGKAKVRCYLYSHTAFQNDRFSYHGTGKELYQGFVKAMVLFGIPYFSLVALHTVWTLPRWVDLLSQSLAALILFLYVPIAIVAGRRYRLSRSSWRGIRFSFHGRTKDYLAIHLRGWLFTFLTLGSYFPYFQTQRQAFLIEHTYFGNQRFHFSGHGSALVIPFALTLFVTYSVLFLCGFSLALHLDNAGLTLLLVPFVIGPTWMWLSAQKHRYFWNHTEFGQATFSSMITWQSLLRLYIGNLALLLITLGLAWSWVTIRNARFYTASLSLHGPTNFDRILQDHTRSSVTGEGFANLFGTGFDMD